MRTTNSEKNNIHLKRVKESIEKIIDKIKKKEELHPKEINMGLSILFNDMFDSNRERWANTLATKHGRFRKDVYDDYMNDDPDDKPITILIPNLFQWQKELLERNMKFARNISYTCPNCKKIFWRQPESRTTCMFCRAPYDYDGVKVLNDIKSTKADWWHVKEYEQDPCPPEKEDDW